MIITYENFKSHHEKKNEKKNYTIITLRVQDDVSMTTSSSLVNVTCTQTFSHWTKTGKAKRFTQMTLLWINKKKYVWFRFVVLTKAYWCWSELYNLMFEYKIIFWCCFNNLINNSVSSLIHMIIQKIICILIVFYLNLKILYNLTIGKTLMLDIQTFTKVFTWKLS